MVKFMFVRASVFNRNSLNTFQGSVNEWSKAKNLWQISSRNYCEGVKVGRKVVFRPAFRSMGLLKLTCILSFTGFVLYNALNSSERLEASANVKEEVQSDA